MRDLESAGQYLDGLRKSIDGTDGGHLRVASDCVWHRYAQLEHLEGERIDEEIDASDPGDEH